MVLKSPIPFGKYILLDRINVGGMAEVFRAKAFGVEGFERVVALKRILPSVAEDTQFITMFIDEAKLAVQLNHANIAQVFDLGKVADSYFIALECIAGKDLRALFDRCRGRGEPIPMPLASYIVMKMCDGLDYAHNKRDTSGRALDLVHRDVSPQNVLISYDGEVKIIDFGIAKATGKAGKTREGILKGKFGYMSPEQVRGLPLDRRSDIFSVGICLYELLTGERLFSGESDLSTLEKVRNVEVPLPSSRNPKIPPGLERIVLKALAKDVDERYQTCMDLQDDISSFLQHEKLFPSAKEVSALMHQLFAKEIEADSVKQEAYEKLERPREGETAILVDSNPSGSSRANGADAVTAVPIEPTAQMPRLRRRGHPADALELPLPMPPVAPPPPEPNPLVLATPRSDNRHVIDGQHADTSDIHTAPSLAVDWDDEELSTQLYGDDDEPRPSSLSGDPTQIKRESHFSPTMPPPYRTPMQPELGRRAFRSEPPLTPTMAALDRRALESPRQALDPLDEVMLNPSPIQRAPIPLQPEPAITSSEATSTYTIRHNTKLPVFSALVVALTLIALAVLGASAYWLFGRRHTGTLHLTTTPSDVVVQFDGMRVSASSSPFLISQVEPDVPHRLEVLRDGYQPWTQIVTVAPGQTVFLPSVVLSALSPNVPEIAVKRETGLALSSDPSGMRVIIDGKPLSSRTPVRLTQLSAGRHRITLDGQPHYAQWQTTVDLNAGEIHDLGTVKLELKAVDVSFSSSPSGASVVLLRGKERRTVGETPAHIMLDMDATAWVVEGSRNGFQTYLQPLVLTGDTTEQKVHLDLSPLAKTEAIKPDGPSSEPRTTNNHRTKKRNSGGAGRPEPSNTGEPGRLSINSRPWSQVFIEGELIGNTPQQNITLEPGSHRITLVNPDFGLRRTVTVRIRSDETTKTIVDLTDDG